MEYCIACGKGLHAQDIAAHRKFINRGSTSFYCKQCLAEKLDISVEILDRKIEHFKRQGCTLFL